MALAFPVDQFRQFRQFLRGDKSDDKVNRIHYSATRRSRRVRPISTAIFSVLATAGFLLLSASFHNQVAVDISLLFKPTTYEVVPGFFIQSLNSTDDANFDFVRPNFRCANWQAQSNFGILNDHGDIDNSSDRWIHFKQKIVDLNRKARLTESYKGSSSLPKLKRSVVSCEAWRRVS